LPKGIVEKYRGKISVCSEPIREVSLYCFAGLFILAAGMETKRKEVLQRKSFS
jgi:hypothetical protein